MSVFTRDRQSRWEKEGGYVYTRFIFFGPEVWEPATFQFRAWFEGRHYDGSKRFSESEFERLARRQRDDPYLICCHARQVYFWWFADRIWNTRTALTDAEKVRGMLLELMREAAEQKAASAPGVATASTLGFDPWDMLDIPRGSGEEAIKQAYYKQLSLYHPDKVAHLGTELQSVAERRTRSINQAYEALTQRA